jgi:hypothetical protein
MPIVRKLITSVLTVLMMVPSQAFADGRHLVPPGKLAALLAQHVERQKADRIAIRQALSRPEVREVAGRMGLDFDRAAAAVDTMADADLVRAAHAARQVNEQLVGGQSITFSTTTIIIILLVVILIIVAVK